jgi:hypothetical protein
VGDGGPNILLLALFRATAEQNHQALAVFSQINSVSGPKIDPTFEHTRTNALDVREVAESQSGDGDSHFGGRSNQTAYGLRPSRSLYSRTSIICYSNTYVTIHIEIRLLNTMSIYPE